MTTKSTLGTFYRQLTFLNLYHDYQIHIGNDVES